MSQAIKLNFMKRADSTSDGPVVFSVMRNEDYFLPHFFRHYRNLGVTEFLIYDDHSDEPALNFLCSQPDCSVLGSVRQFGDTFGLNGTGVPRRLPHLLKEKVPEALFPGRWVLTVDADEFFIIPSRFDNLLQMIEFLENSNQFYCTAPMVDFYGETLYSRNYSINLDPFIANPNFDAGPYYIWDGGLQPFLIAGGVRYKILRMLLQRHPEVAAAVFGSHFPAAAKYWKVPLLKHGAGILRLGDHEISVAPKCDVTGALAHFKFYPGLDGKISNALVERQYYHGSVEYAFLDAAIKHLSEVSLVTWETCRFEGAQSLERAQLIRAPSLLDAMGCDVM